MKDYSKMSEFEIAHKTAKLTGLKLPCSNSLLYNTSGKWELFDPCNNPADAWPIIIGNRIALHPLHPTYENEWRASAEDDCGFIGYSSSNLSPLRAAMIVFLMMNDKEVEK